MRAARSEKSLSRMVSEMLQRLMEEEEGYAEAMTSFLLREPQVLKVSGSYPTRQEIHER